MHDTILSDTILDPPLPEFITFVSSQDLENEYPSLTPKQREHEAARKHGAIFLIGIGGKLASGSPHDQRAPDYDDWTLNGDIIVWNPVLQTSLELSSMGIRVNGESLISQVRELGREEKLSSAYSKGIIDGTLPLTVGGGIGQSRIVMFMLGKRHIGEVQVSEWDDNMFAQSEYQGVILL